MVANVDFIAIYHVRGMFNNNNNNNDNNNNDNHDNNNSKEIGLGCGKSCLSQHSA